MSVHKLGDGRYRVMINLGRDAQGRRRMQTEVVRGTKREAEHRERELLNARDSGTSIEPHRFTVAEFMERWLDSTRDKVEERTWGRYEQLTRNQIVPALGHLRLAKVRPLHIEAAEAEWLRRGNRRTNPPSPLSPRSVLHAHRCLHTAFERAVKWRLLAVNPVDSVDPPSVPQREGVTLTPDQAWDLLQAIEGTRYELPILIGLYCGLRPAEYLALRWRDIDLDRGELRVQQNVHRVRNDRVTEHMGVSVAGFRFGPPKTHRSRRPVAIPRELVIALRNWRKVHAAQRLEAAQWHELDLVFCDAAGLPYKLQSVEDEFHKAVVGVGLPTFRLYDLRHSMASLLLYSGRSLKLIAARLGHSSETLVLNTYGHLQPGEDREAAEDLWEVTRTPR